MTQVTVKELAQMVDTPVKRLLLQVCDAGLPYTSVEQVVMDSEKQAPLIHLEGSHGNRVSELRKITLQRKTVTTLRAGGSKTVSVGAHKRGTYVGRNPDEIEAECQRELEEQRAAEEAGRLKTEKAAAHQRTEEEAYKVEEATCAKAAQEAVATAGAEPAMMVDVATAESVIKPAVVEECKKEEPCRVPKRNEDDDRHDHKYTQHRPSVKEKEKALALRVAPRSTDEESDDYRRGDRGGKLKLEKHNQHKFQNPTESIVREVNVGETIIVAELAVQMSAEGAEIVKFVFKMGSPVTINQVLDQEIVQLVAGELGHKVRLVSENALEEQLVESLKSGGGTVIRAPIVTVMGRVDHGKIPLLDYIRRAEVAAGEVGGITQHIGAYHAETKRGVMTFLDIPGHAALTTMRAHGTQVIDIVILMVMASGGVMPQTQKTVQHVKATGVLIVVAVNEIDKPETSPGNIRDGLAALSVIPEKRGGDAPFVPVSAELGTDANELLEAVLLQAEVFELKVTPSTPGCGTMVEPHLDKERGPVTTVLVQDGTLRQGDMVLASINYGRVRTTLDENGKPTKKAGPSIPVKILGLDGTPDAGDEMAVVADERETHKVALSHQGKFREVKLACAHAGKLESIFENMGQEEEKTLNIVLKADARGLLEALQGSSSDPGNDKVQTRMVGGGIGGIIKSDANLALAPNVVLFSLNVRTDAGAHKTVEAEGLDMRYYSVIYDIIEDVKRVLTGMLDSDLRENILGIAEIRDVSRSSKLGAIAGCMVTEGMAHRNRPIRVLHDDVAIFEGEPESLRRLKDDVAKVHAGIECGIGVKSCNDVRVDDKIEVFRKVEVAHSP